MPVSVMVRSGPIVGVMRAFREEVPGIMLTAKEITCPAAPTPSVLSVRVIGFSVPPLPVILTSSFSRTSLGSADSSSSRLMMRMASSMACSVPLTTSFPPLVPVALLSPRMSISRGATWYGLRYRRGITSVITSLDARIRRPACSAYSSS